MTRPYRERHTHRSPRTAPLSLCAMAYGKTEVGSRFCARKCKTRKLNAWSNPLDRPGPSACGVPAPAPIARLPTPDPGMSQSQEMVFLAHIGPRAQGLSHVGGRARRLERPGYGTGAQRVERGSGEGHAQKPERHTMRHTGEQRRRLILSPRRGRATPLLLHHRPRCGSRRPRRRGSRLCATAAGRQGGREPGEGEAGRGPRERRSAPPPR